MKKNKKQKTNSKKTYTKTFLIIITLWFSLAFLVYAFPPTNFLIISIFLINLFLATLFTFSVILANTRRGLLAAIFITITLILRYYNMGNILNILLLTGSIIAFEFYFSSKS